MNCYLPPASNTMASAACQSIATAYNCRYYTNRGIVSATTAMAKKNTTIICLTLAAMLVFCAKENEQRQEKPAASNEAADSNKVSSKLLISHANGSVAAPWPSPKNMTPLSFLEAMKKRENTMGELWFVTMANDFPENWIHKEDIGMLINLIDSKERCNCFMNPISSKIPKGNANVGGYAIELINAYKEKRKVNFGLYLCPETNKQKVDELVSWWAKQRQ
jgi:hypothetical protein